jgi:repressor LexA
MTSPELPSQKQKNILLFIWNHLREYNRPPTIREIGQAQGIDHPSVVKYHVGRLEKMDLLNRDGSVARGLSLPDKALSLLGKLSDSVREATSGVQIKIVGDIVAGQPAEMGNGSWSTYDHDETILVDASLLPRRREKLQALRVRGRSMIDALVNDGDIVILQKEYDVRNGDMVAVWLQHREEMTLKHIFIEGETTRLQPANPEHEPIFVPTASVEVQGKVIMIQRQMIERGPARPLA